ncbi:hypothetical protein ACIOGT_38195 [Streptomyces microflavus]|uniref:hypothetical protein n=1 Tax=Streptomyces microflavus TaxID=1919 RepID=UPI00380B904C
MISTRRSSSTAGAACRRGERRAEIARTSTLDVLHETAGPLPGRRGRNRRGHGWQIGARLVTDLLGPDEANARMNTRAQVVIEQYSNGLVRMPVCDVPD